MGKSSTQVATPSSETTPVPVPTEKKSSRSKKSSSSSSRSKSSKSSKAESKVDDVVVVPVVVPVVVEEVQVVVEEVPVKVVEDDLVLAEPEVEVESSESKVTMIINSLLEELGTISLTIKRLQGEVRTLQRSNVKQVRELSKRRRKKPVDLNKPKRQPSGFARESLISEELCGFLEVEIGTKLPRTQVTKRINNYIKAHDLQKPDNRKIILPDAKLAKILNSTSDDEVTYFNLQRFMKHHYLKIEPEVVADVAVVAVVKGVTA
jgi:chromatin remodeling complex protein RSC6